jgi:PAS domain S-box-containing protein
MLGLMKSTREIKIAEYEELLSLPTLMMVVICPDNTIHKINGSSILGWQPQEILDLPITDIIHPDDHQRVSIAIERVRAGQDDLILDLRIRCKRKDQVYQWVSWTARSRDQFLYASGIDVTDKIDLEVQLKEKELAARDQKFLAQAANILSSSLDYKATLLKMCKEAISYFCDGCVVDRLRADGSVERIIALHPEPAGVETLYEIQKKYPERYEKDHMLFNTLITGKTLIVEDMEKLYPAMANDHSMEYVAELKKLNVQSVMIVRLKGRESLLGTILFFKVKNSQEQSNFQERHVWLANELGYRVSMALENDILYENSQDAIRSRDEFLSIASHELKTPLTAMLLQNQMSRRQLDKGQVFTPDQFSKMLNADFAQLNRITRLINDMLDISRIRATKLAIYKEDFELAQFIQDVVGRMGPALEEMDCPMVLKLPPGLTVHADLYRIEQVLINLLTNAMKYGAGKPIKIEVIASSQDVKILVQDQGMGIKPADIERIFLRFERAVSSSEISGMGLGLFISREIMEQHDGALNVVSEPGVGSIFIMELPLQGS